MSPGRISKRVVADRLNWIERMIKEIQSLPLENYKTFVGDKKNVWSAESCLRRSLEALMDLGRHIVAKGFGRGVTEYREIGFVLEEVGALDESESDMFKRLAGYRNRMVHFYHEVSDNELFEICSSQLSDVIYVTEAIKIWINSHPELIDGTL